MATREPCNQEYSWRSSGHRRRQAPLLSDVQCSGATIAASLLTHWPWPPRALRGAPMDPHSHAPATAASALPTTLAAHLNCASAPFCWRGLRASAISGTDSGGRNTYKSRSETIAETQSHVTNEKSQDLSSWLYKPQSYTSADGLLNSMPAKDPN